MFRRKFADLTSRMSREATQHDRWSVFKTPIGQWAAGPAAPGVYITLYPHKKWETFPTFTAAIAFATEAICDLAEEADYINEHERTRA